MQFEFLHEIIMWSMFGVTLLMIYAAIERGIFFVTSLREGGALEKYIQSHLSDRNLHEEILTEFAHAKSPQVTAICEVVKAGDLPKDQMAYLIQSQYADAQPLINRRLWILETIATLAPLMGLLGTIFGIVDSFQALSQGSGSSDPSQVSSGIGTALFATAFGIGIALFAFLFHNYFNAKAEQASSQIKRASLRLLAQH